MGFPGASRFLLILLTWTSAVIGTFALTLIDVLKNETECVLAFGDSLTHGMQHPYTLRLRELIHNSYEQQHPSSQSKWSRVVNAGKSAEQTSSMVTRLPAILQDHHPRLVIILGGTNDLGYRKDPRVALDNIITLHKLAHSSGDNLPVYTIALTIPQIGWSWVNQTQRMQINAGIRMFARENQAKMAVLEMEDRFDQKDPNNHKYWANDFVHFTVLGYDTIGELVFDTIQNFQIGINRGAIK